MEDDIDLGGLFYAEENTYIDTHDTFSSSQTSSFISKSKKEMVNLKALLLLAAALLRIVAENKCNQGQWLWLSW